MISHMKFIEPGRILIRVIVLRSPGTKAFLCGSASFEELTNISNKEKGLAFFSGFAHVINAMRKCPKLIIGRIHGKCVGGGVGLAAAVDYAIALEGAEVKLSELAKGFGPFVIAPAVERKIGVGAFGSLAIDASLWRNAEWALRKGLYSELHHTTKRSMKRYQDLAHIVSLQSRSHGRIENKYFGRIRIIGIICFQNVPQLAEDWH